MEVFFGFTFANVFYPKVFLLFVNLLIPLEVNFYMEVFLAWISFRFDTSINEMSVFSDFLLPVEKTFNIYCRQVCNICPLAEKPEYDLIFVLNILLAVSPIKFSSKEQRSVPRAFNCIDILTYAGTHPNANLVYGRLSDP